MSRKTTAALIAALGINFALAGGALMLANLNKPAEYEPDAALAAAYSDIQQVAGIAVDAQQGDVAVPLKAAQEGGNTRVTFTCGKQIPTGREVHEGTWDGIAGAVLYRPEGQKLLAIEAVFDVRSLRTDANALTQTVTSKERWFDIENHPTATFKCDTVMPVDAATPSHTHDLSGQFTLNGITQPVTIPAKLSFSGQSLVLDASFTILRSDYKVEKRATSVAGAVGGVVSNVDDAVELTVQLSASPDPMAVLAELAQQIEQQREELQSAHAEIKRVDGALQYMRSNYDALERKIADIAFSSPQSVDLSDIPDRYVDELPAVEKTIPFEMILVPGDPQAQADPFYISKHEVTWQMLTDWLYCSDLDAAEAARQIAAGLRPTPLWGTLSEQFQVSSKSHPAMGMTRLTAESFCKWLSEQTGRRYRLPTREEWLHALEAGGGFPDDLDPVAWHAGNAVEDFVTGHRRTSPVATKEPNALGVHDMLGGVAEWVTGVGQDRFAVGGSINTPPGDINEQWRAVEDFDVWSASYPNLPISRFWYVDYYYTGIRLICEPASVAANPPKPSE